MSNSFKMSSVYLQPLSPNIVHIIRVKTSVLHQLNCLVFFRSVLLSRAPQCLRILLCPQGIFKLIDCSVFYWFCRLQGGVRVIDIWSPTMFNRPRYLCQSWKIVRCSLSKETTFKMANLRFRFYWEIKDRWSEKIQASAGEAVIIKF